MNGKSMRCVMCTCCKMWKKRLKRVREKKIRIREYKKRKVKKTINWFVIYYIIIYSNGCVLYHCIYNTNTTRKAIQPPIKWLYENARKYNIISNHHMCNQCVGDSNDINVSSPYIPAVCVNFPPIHAYTMSISVC